MSSTTRDYVLKFWTVIDEILNAILFLLIGLEVIAIAFDARTLLLGVLMIPLVIAARYVAVAAPLLALRTHISLGPAGVPTLVWGGLRGGISIALASRCRLAMSRRCC